MQRFGLHSCVLLLLIKLISTVTIFFSNRAPAAAALLEKGADCNRENKNKCVPLHVAVNKGHLDVVKILLREMCNVNLQVRTISMRDIVGGQNLENF